MAVFSSTTTSIQEGMSRLSGIGDMIAKSVGQNLHAIDKAASPLTTDTENTRLVNSALTSATANSSNHSDLSMIDAMVDTILVQREIAAEVQVLRVTMDTEQILMTRQPVAGYGKTQQQP